MRSTAASASGPCGPSHIASSWLWRCWVRTRKYRSIAWAVVRPNGQTRAPAALPQNERNVVLKVHVAKLQVRQLAAPHARVEGQTQDRRVTPILEFLPFTDLEGPPDLIVCQHRWRLLGGNRPSYLCHVIVGDLASLGPHLKNCLIPRYASQRSRPRCFPSFEQIIQNVARCSPERARSAYRGLRGSHRFAGR
jgi:hypothetical protein